MRKSARKRHLIKKKGGFGKRTAAGFLKVLFVLGSAEWSEVIGKSEESAE